MRDLGPPYDFPDAIQQLGAGEVNRPLPWDSLTEEQKEFQSNKMAIHAAMIDCMDREIGRVLERLREMDQFKNTLVLFLSDNGASAEIMVRGDGHDPEAPMGSWASHLCLGPGWSTTSNTPFRYHKTWTHEGGIATPLVVHWPDGIKAQGELRHQVGHVIDVWPTILDVAGIEASSDGPPRQGISLVGAFDKPTQQRRTLWWSHEGNRALREGRWKVSLAARSGEWELYDLKVDRAETNDRSDSRPEKLESLKKKWHDMNERHAELAQRE